jgi:RimJ/RimL family protein N-acetyltransferase
MAEEFQWRRPPFVLAPYVRDKGIIAAEDLVAIYHRLKADDLFDVVFHDNPDMNLLDVMTFFSHPTVALQVIMYTDGDKFLDFAGIAWLSGMERYGDRQRALASFCVFKKYQNPEVSNAMAAFVLDYWFNCLGMDIVVGMTPAANVLAVRFIKRIGFIELCRVPMYSALLGKICDCVLTCINKDQYAKVYGGANGIGTKTAGE